MESYPYGFNGKENDKETVGTGEGTQDYGMRIYNPGLGKFLSVDPLQKDFPWWSPYHFAGDSPIENIDLDGLETYNYRLSFDSKTGKSHIQKVGEEHGILCDAAFSAYVEYNGKNYFIGATQFTSDALKLIDNVYNLNGRDQEYLDNFFENKHTYEELQEIKQAQDEAQQEEFASYYFGVKYAQSRQQSEKLTKQSTTNAQKASNNGVDNKGETNKAKKNGATRAAMYSTQWKSASLSSAINKFAPGSTGTLVGDKMIFSNSKTGMQVIYDTKGDYFRIQNTNLTGKRNYTDLNGNVINNKIEDGKEMGKSQSEYNADTHFNNTHQP